VRPRAESNGRGFQDAITPANDGNIQMIGTFFRSTACACRRRKLAACHYAMPMLAPLQIGPMSRNLRLAPRIVEAQYGENASPTADPEPFAPRGRDSRLIDREYESVWTDLTSMSPQAKLMIAE
jgi:hypothetical protein